MDLQLVCQVALVVHLLVMFLVMLSRDILGQPARQPKGFTGAVATLILLAVSVYTYYYAGAFTRLW